MSPYSEGFQAFKEGKPETENPYRRGSKAYEEWLDGYDAAFNSEIKWIEKNK